MRSGRLLSALMLLQAQGRMSARAIAERLEISERTAHRDMEALCVAGVPLVAHRGAAGGWELQRGWRTKVPGLDDAELRGLLMVQPSALGDAKLSAAAQRAYDKLMASLPQPMRAQAESMRGRLHIDPTGWRPAGDDLSALAVAQEAVGRDCKLTFVYTRPDGETYSRTVDPLGIVCKQTTWYLVARTPAGMRTYRVSRMKEAVVLAMPFERPAKFDLGGYWKSSTARFKEERSKVTATLGLTKKTATMLGRWCEMKPVQKAVMGLEAGWSAVEVEFESLEQARFVVLGLGAGARALLPRALADEVDEERRKAFGRLRGWLI